jgi:hypothetical protein
MRGSLIKSNFKVQDTTKSVWQKRCGMIRLNVPNFLYIYENPLFEWKNNQKPRIIGFFEKVKKIACFLDFKHPVSDLSLV